MKCVLSTCGGNHFKIPHVKKVQRMRAGENIEYVYSTRNNIDTAEAFLAIPDPPGDN